jgi:hypothetical protein
MMNADEKDLLTGVAALFLLGIGLLIGTYKAVVAYRIWTLGILAFCISLAAWVGIWRLMVELAGYINVRYGKPMINGLTQKGWGVLLGLSIICSLVFPLTFNGDWLHFPLIRAKEPMSVADFDKLFAPASPPSIQGDGWVPYYPHQTCRDENTCSPNRYRCAVLGNGDSAR